MEIWLPILLRHHKNAKSVKTRKESDMEIADAITEEAEEIALTEYKKPLMELGEYERNEVIRIAEDRVLGL